MPLSHLPTDPQALLRLAQKDFDAAVYAYLTSKQRTPQHVAAFRDGTPVRDADDPSQWRPAVVELLAESLERIERAVTHQRDQARTRRRPDEVAGAGKVLDRIAVEKKAVRPLAGQAREQRLSRQRSRGPRYRAMVRLAQENPVRFRQLTREEEARDEARGGGSGPGAPSPPRVVRA